MRLLTKRIVITMDIEPDLTKYLKESFLGVESLIKFLDMLDKYNIKCDFFVTGNVAEKYPDIVEDIAQRNHFLGCHGHDHSIDYYCKKNFDWQKTDIEIATKTIEKITGKRPTMFRAPNFSANGDTIRALEALGYEVDSSVLPGRRIRKWQAFTIYDFRAAPVSPYNPSTGNIATPGKSRIVEIPLTNNPEIPEAPVGVGFLNLYGPEKTAALVDRLGGEYITFLMHPWEVIDLGRYRPEIPDNWKRGCRDNLEELDIFFSHIGKKHGFISISEIKMSWDKKSDTSS